MVDVVRVDPASFRWGTPHGPADALDRIRSACADSDHHDPLDEAARLRLAHHGLDEAALWMEADSGFLLALRAGDDTRVDLAVAPTARRCGFGGRLLDAALGELTGPLVAWSHGDHPAAAVLAARHGFGRARELWVMRRDGAGPVPHEPPDVEIRAWRPADQPELLRVNATAFAGHPEQAALTAADLAERMAEPWFDPAGLLVAVEDGRMLGFHWTKVHPGGGGEVYVIAVAPEAQGRRLGRALLLAGLHHLGGLDVPDVHLYVESDNTAARSLYSGLGFTHADSDTHVQYRRP